MADVIYVAVICAFFALCVVYVRWCDRIVGPDEFAVGPSPQATAATGDEPSDSTAVHDVAVPA